ncbi:MAG: hypothetical protein KAH30_05980 [Caldisericia bacterium]|nr:hypothetical protein [Caldisericia bacterium]
MTNFWNRTVHRMIPRHGAGLFGVGSAFSASLYLSVLVAEIISISFVDGGITDAIIRVIYQPSYESMIMIGIFAFIWIFLGAIAFAGGCRYLIGCVDPKHIAQRTFFNGIRFYWKKMLVYTVFLVIGGISSLVLLWFLFNLGTNSVTTLNLIYIIISIAFYTILTTMFWSKLSYIPYFLISGESLSSSISKSWLATKKRIWSIWILRVCMVIFISVPVVIKYLWSPSSQIPSLAVWPFVALIVFGYVELIVVRGYQEWQEKKKLPVVTGKFADKDVKDLDAYDNHNGPNSMEF